MAQTPAMSQKKKTSRTSVDGVTPLMVACQQGDALAVKQLLHRKGGGGARDRDRTGKTALHYCAENMSTECVELLFGTEPQLINAADDEGYTPLHLAVIAGQKIVIRWLVARGANINHLDAELHSVVHWATDALEIVLDAGADACTADVHGAYPLHYAAQMCGRHKGVATAGRDDRVGLVALKKLLARGVSVNVVDCDGRQPLLWAASSGSADAILALVNAGADVNASDKEGLSALHCAASRGHSDCVETLVALCGADVDLTDSSGCTALFYGVSLGHADCAQLLLNYGANPNHQDHKGRTSAYCGASKGQMETLRLLLQHGADLWLRTVKGDVALHEAVGSGRKELIMWILRQRTSASNLANNDGRCPIHVAAINNNIEMCKILIDHEAEVNAIMRNARGQLLTALDAALRRGNRSCAKFLQMHGAMPAAKLTDSKALRRALSQALTDSQRDLSNIQQLSVIQADDYPCMTDSQMSTKSSVVHAPQFKPVLRTISRLEDSSTQTQVEESYYAEHSKDVQIQLTSADLRPFETESGLRRRRTRRRASRRSLAEPPQPPPNDEELRWKSRQRSSFPNDSDLETASDDDGQPDFARRLSLYHSDYGRTYAPYDASEVVPPPDGVQSSDLTIHIVQVEPADQGTAHTSVLSSHMGTGSSGHKDSGFSDVHVVDPNPDGLWPAEIDNSETEAVRMAGGSVEGAVQDGAQVGGVQFSDDHRPTLTERSMGGPAHTKAHENGAGHGGTRSRSNSSVSSDSSTSAYNKNSSSKKNHNKNRKNINSNSNNSRNGQFAAPKAVVAPYPLDSLDALPSGQLSARSGGGQRITRDDQELPALVLKSPRYIPPNNNIQSDNHSNTVDQSQRTNALVTTANGATKTATPRLAALNRRTSRPSQGSDEVTVAKKPFHLRRSKSQRVDRQSQSVADDANFKYDSLPTISFTRAAQMRTRRYNLERKIFQQLLELKQMQIVTPPQLGRIGYTSEQVNAKRLIESFRKDSVTVGLRPYDGGYSFAELETYLYGQLRLVQGGHYQSNLPLVDGQEDGRKSQTECTLPTSRCPHAMYAYTGIPCAAYIPYHRHHPLTKPSEAGRTVLPKLNNSVGNITTAAP